MSLHKDIRLVFQLGDRWFEAVGFLKQGEESISHREAFQRTDNGRLIRSKEDWDYIKEHRHGIVEVVSDYFLLTAVPHSHSPNRILGMDWRDPWWFDEGKSLDSQCAATCLILRNCDNPQGDGRRAIVGPQKYVRFVFKLGDRWFEAVGFLEQKERSLCRRKALQRADNDRLVKTREDWGYIQRHQQELPTDLHKYRLMSAVRLPGSASSGVDMLYTRWWPQYRHWSNEAYWMPTRTYSHGDPENPNARWQYYHLVLRHCDPPEELQAA